MSTIIQPLSICDIQALTTPTISIAHTPPTNGPAVSTILLTQKEKFDTAEDKTDKEKTTLIVPIAKVFVAGIAIVLAAGVVFRATAWTVKGYRQMDKARNS